MNAQTINMLRRDVAPKLRRITASACRAIALAAAEALAKTGTLVGPRVYPWGSIFIKQVLYLACLPPQGEVWYPVGHIFSSGRPVVLSW